MYSIIWKLMTQIVDDFISSSKRLKARADFARTTALGADAVIRTSAPVTCASQDNCDPLATWLKFEFALSEKILIANEH